MALGDLSYPVTAQMACTVLPPVGKDDWAIMRQNFTRQQRPCRCREISDSDAVVVADWYSRSVVAHLFDLQANVTRPRLGLLHSVTV